MQFLCSVSVKVPDNSADKQLLRNLLAKKIRRSESGVGTGQGLDVLIDDTGVTEILPHRNANESFVVEGTAYDVRLTIESIEV